MLSPSVLSVLLLILLIITIRINVRALRASQQRLSKWDGGMEENAKKEHLGEEAMPTQLEVRNRVLGVDLIKCA